MKIKKSEFNEESLDLSKYLAIARYKKERNEYHERKRNTKNNGRKEK